jgi:hypothetical protein
MPKRVMFGPSSSRGLVVKALKKFHGVLDEPEGFCTPVLYEAVQKLGWQGTQEGLSSLLRKMERDGMITRDIPPNTKRCFQIRLIDAGEYDDKPNVPNRAPAAKAAAAPTKKPVSQPKKASDVEPEPDLEVSDDEIGALLPILVESIGEDRIIDVLLERASQNGGASEEDVEARIAEIEQKWSDKLVDAMNDLNATKADASGLAAQYSELVTRYDERLVEIKTVRTEMAELQKASNELLDQAADEIAELKAQLAAMSRPRRAAGDGSAAVIQDIISRRGGAKAGRTKG